MHEALSSHISVVAFEDVQNLSIDHVNTRLLAQLFANTNRPTKATSWGLKIKGWWRTSDTRNTRQISNAGSRLSRTTQRGVGLDQTSFTDSPTKPGKRRVHCRFERSRVASNLREHARQETVYEVEPQDPWEQDFATSTTDPLIRLGCPEVIGLLWEQWEQCPPR